MEKQTTIPDTTDIKKVRSLLGDFSFKTAYDLYMEELYEDLVKKGIF
jgi:hypothetical protein